METSNVRRGPSDGDALGWERPQLFEEVGVNNLFNKVAIPARFLCWERPQLFEGAFGGAMIRV
jgi:hypothetical protein